MTTDPAPQSQPQDRRLWRYMSFGRFIWLLAEKSLWLTRADKLDDALDMMFSRAERENWVTAYVSNPTNVAHVEQTLGAVPKDALRDQIQRLFLQLLNDWRQYTYINCWTATDGESHAMWSVYCRPPDGVAVRTTLNRLRASLPLDGATRLLEVLYRDLDMSTQFPSTPEELVARKVKPYSYENEWRVVRFNAPPTPGTLGAALVPPSGWRMPWDPETQIEGIVVHPAADPGSIRAVNAAIERFAPQLIGKVEESGMAPNFRHGRP